MIGVTVGLTLRDDDPAVRADAATAELVPLTTLPQLSYPDLDGALRRSDEWAEKVLVLNFWATWCPPCKKEIPLFVELQAAYAGRGVQFVGLAIDELEPTRQFAESMAVNYPTLIADLEAMQLARRLGNRSGALPFTVISLPGGEIVLRHTGELTRAQLDPLLSRLAQRP